MLSALHMCTTHGQPHQISFNPYHWQHTECCAAPDFFFSSQLFADSCWNIYIKYAENLCKSVINHFLIADSLISPHPLSCFIRCHNLHNDQIHLQQQYPLQQRKALHQSSGQSGAQNEYGFLGGWSGRLCRQIHTPIERRLYLHLQWKCWNDLHVQVLTIAVWMGLQHLSVSLMGDFDCDQSYSSFCREEDDRHTREEADCHVWVE